MSGADLALKFLGTILHEQSSWVARDGAPTLTVADPATGALVASLTITTKAQICAKIDQVSIAQALWAEMTASARQNILRKWHDLAQKHEGELAALLTLEQGKPLSEAKAEISSSLKNILWSAGLCERKNGYEEKSHINGALNEVHYEPVGVVAAITPWNFPSAMITRKVAPALAAGCGVILKPAEDTPLSAIALAKLAYDAGIPRGLFALVITNREGAAEFSDVVFSDKRVRMVSFTGSTAIGKTLIASSAQNVTKLSLELGGNAPFIICADADLDKAVEGAFASKFRNAGQTCICANRIYVHADIYDVFMERFVARVRAVKIGNGFEDGVEIGPLINERAQQNVQNFIKKLESESAQKIYAAQLDLAGSFLAPMIYACAEGCAAPQEEIFGPIACIYKFDSYEDVVQKANETDYGLAAYIYAKDNKLSMRLAKALHFGMVGINETRISDASIPFGGVKQSGIGREGGYDSLKNFMVTKFICKA